MDIIEQARALGKEIQKDERYAKMQAALVKADADKGLQDLIGQFNMKRMSAQNEMQQENHDENKIKGYQLSMDTLYETIMKNPNMIDYNAAKTDMELLMRRVNAILEESANGGDPETADYHEHECGGHCEECGGDCH